MKTVEHGDIVNTVPDEIAEYRKEHGWSEIKEPLKIIDEIARLSDTPEAGIINIERNTGFSAAYATNINPLKEAMLSKRGISLFPAMRIARKTGVEGFFLVWE
jgi:hypothetical protein